MGHDPYDNSGQSEAALRAKREEDVREYNRHWGLGPEFAAERSAANGPAPAHHGAGSLPAPPGRGA